MTDVLRTIAADIGVFAGTNVDDLTVLTVLFLSARSGGPRPWQIVAGQYLGVGALVALSLLAALGLVVVPDAWVGLLGLIPLGLGVYVLIRALRGGDDDDAPPTLPPGVLPVAGVTVANGADNVAVYTPLLRTATPGEILVMAAVFAVMIALWCAAGALLGGHRHVVAFVERFGRWLVPLVFIAIGATIIAGSGVVTRLLAP